ncbi:MAG: TonB-dependent receptor [Caulobacterales bacterium]|nr:TonB-dependent receptor [Caulobacterales bacterium]
MPIILAALAAALIADQDAPPPAAETTVEAVEVTAAARIRGDLKEGVLNYPSSFFTPMRPTTALDMVTWLPGFTLEDTRDVRGLEGAIGNVLIDGKPPTSKTDTLASVLRRLPVEQVERVDLIVGGAPGINMRGRNIVANVILKVSARPKRVITGQTFVDTHGRVSPHLIATTSSKRDGRSLDATIQAARSVAIFPGFGWGPYVRRDGAGAVLFEADEAYLVSGPNATGNLSYERPAGGGLLRLSALGEYFGTDLDDVATLKPGPGEFSYRWRQAYRRGEAGVRWERAFGRAGLELQALERITIEDRQDETVRPPAPTTFDFDHTDREHIVRAVLRFKQSEALTLETFAEAAVNGFENASTGTVNGAPRFIPVANVEVTERRGETGASLAWKPGPRFSLDAALKVEASDLEASGDVVAQRDFVYAKPRLALSWSPDGETQVRLRAEHEVGQVGFSSFISSAESNTGQIRVGNPQLRPQRAWVAEAAVQRRFGQGGDVSLTVRSKALRDVVDVAPVFSPQGVFAMTANIGDGRETALIASATVPLKRLGLGGAMLKGGFTLLDQTVTDPLTGRERPLSYTAQRMADLHFTQDFPQWNTNWGLDLLYRGGVTVYRPFGDETTAAWPRLNVYVERRLRPDLALRIEVQNLPGVRSRQTFSVYDGPQDRSPLLYVDEKRLSVGPILFVRLRKTLN